jgi:uncharacterized protein (DUF1800 family)
MKLLFTILLLSAFYLGSAQYYTDYIGAGHDIDVTVTSSDLLSESQNTVNGEGLDLDIQGSSKFLTYATLGATIEEIEEVSQIGMEAWIDQQIQLPVTGYAQPTVENIFYLYDKCKTTLGEDACNQQFQLTTFMWRYAWWHNIMRSEDRLRHRVALALSEILVISDQSDLVSFPHGLAAYYDILSKHAFGNYRDLLMDVTLNPSMGFYLSHINNPKTVELLNIRPDENYAREIMQLFTIGLYELNLDGSRKIDLTNGLWIPTYDNDDIKGLAKVFTGLSGSKWADENNTDPVRFGRRFNAYSLLDPMAMYENWHEPGPKTIVGDFTIPDGQTGMEDIEMAIDRLFNHDNVGPFLAKRLIQRLVKSNPTPGYIQRIAVVFNDNGQGVRGDLGAVIKAVFLDEEALDCYWSDDLSSGMLKSPTLRLTQLMHGLKAETKSEQFWNSAAIFNAYTEHHPLSSPTVFNFYDPEYVPNSEFAYDNLVGPEYQILNSSTSSNYINYMLFAIMGDYINDRYNLPQNRRIPNFLNEPNFIPYHTREEQEELAAYLSDQKWLDLSFYPEEMVDYLDIVLAQGSLSDDKKEKIISSIQNPVLFDPISGAFYAAFMVMIDPDFVILK